MAVDHDAISDLQTSEPRHHEHAAEVNGAPTECHFDHSSDSMVLESVNIQVLEQDLSHKMLDRGTHGALVAVAGSPIAHSDERQMANPVTPI